MRREGKKNAMSVVKVGKNVCDDCMFVTRKSGKWMTNEMR